MLNLKLYILSVYRSPSDCFDTFLGKLNDSLNLIGWDARVVIAGDFNVHFGTDSIECMDLCGMLGSFGFSRTIMDATRGENCIDNIFVNFEVEDCQIGQHDTDFSDHRAQWINLPVSSSMRDGRRTSFICRPITGMGKVKFFSLIQDMTWDFLDDVNNSADDKFSLFLELIMIAFNDSFPEKVYVKRNNQHRTINWFTEDLKNMRETLKFYNELYKKYPSQYLKNSLKSYRYEYKKALKNSKISANDKLIQNSSNPTKSMWQIINEHRGLPQSTDPGSGISPDQFNTFFARIADNIIAGIDPSLVDPVENAQAVQKPFHFKKSLLMKSEKL